MSDARKIPLQVENKVDYCFLQADTSKNSIIYKKHTISCKAANGPLLKEGFATLEFTPAAAIAKSLCWPSANSLLRV